MKGLFTFANIRKVIEATLKVANAISLIGGVTVLGFEAKDAFDKHQANKNALEEVKAVEVEYLEDTDVPEADDVPTYSEDTPEMENTEE